MYLVRKATKRDLVAVERWLRREQAETGEGFLCNWRVIDAAYEREDLAVLAAKDDVVAFVADTAAGPDILEVRPDVRKNGYGAVLAKWAIAAAYDRGNCVIQFECAPVSSVPFWEKMGFTIEGFRGQIFARMILERRFSLPSGPQIPFFLAFYPEERAWKPNTEPFRSYRGEGLLSQSGSIRLPERAICYSSMAQSFADCIVRLEAGGVALFEDKLKRSAARAYGVSKDPAGNFYIDEILRPMVENHDLLSQRAGKRS